MDIPTDLYLVNFILAIKYQFNIVDNNNGIDINIRLYAYDSTLTSSTKTELGIPTGRAPIRPAIAGFATLLPK